MAKEKKRGFFSWLGLGRQDEDKTEQPQPAPEAPQADDATPAAPEPAQNTSDEAPEQPAPNNTALAETGETPAPESQPTETAAEIPPTPVEPPETVALVAEPTADAEPQTDTVAEDGVEPEPETVIVPAAPVVSQEQERPTKEGFFARLKRSLVKTRQNLGSGFVGLFRGKKIDDDLFDELEEQLLIADVGVETTRKIIDRLTEHASRKQLKDAEALIALLKAEMSDILAKVDAPLDIDSKTPFVILMVGVNGVGKTTTIGKLARSIRRRASR